MMEKRFILFIILTFLVFVGFQYLAPKKNQPPLPVAQTADTKAATPADTIPPAPAPAVSAAPVADSAADTLTAPVMASDTQATAQTVVIEGDLYRAVLDNRGGVLTSWELKDYRTTKKHSEEESRPFDMISGASRNDLRYPGALLVNDNTTDATINTSYYTVAIEGAESVDSTLKPPVAVRFTLRRGDLQIEKVWRFDPDNYTAGVAITATRNGKPLEGRFFLGEDIGPASEHFLSSAVHLASVYFSGGKLHREDPPDDPMELRNIYGDIHWAGLDLHYFSMIAIPERPLANFNIQSVKLQETSIDGKATERNMLRVALPMAASGQTNYGLYLGPKKEDNLRRAGATDLSDVIDYGMFSILVYPLLAALRWIHQFVNNYGFAIILLTFALSLILFPFRLKSMHSMKKMSVLQPQIKAIQDKYRQYKAADPRKRDMNAEIMALYKEHNANPVGGCLPLLLQMPLLFAFYSLLANAIDLRQAPFIWWIADLSAKDPYYVLPIVMGLTSFISQKMTPMSPSTDPTQAKVMMFMPLLFVFMFLNLSSGLNLYFLCSNIFQISFQKIAERWMPEVKTVPAPTRTKSKKV